MAAIVNMTPANVEHALLIIIKCLDALYEYENTTTQFGLQLDTLLSLGGFRARDFSGVDGRGMLLSVMRAKRSHDAIGVGGGEPISKTAFSA